MIDFDSMFQNENTENIIVFLVSGTNGINFNLMQSFFRRRNPTVIENGEFLEIFRRLQWHGVIDVSHKILIKKGWAWYPPQFMLLKKYNIG
ncbi:hypothetical protein R0H17_05280 [Phytobacter diazotrophicus]|uniref:hypothetical protein n=1 Tax=Phytobacter diazotrophicus TaxID=395631 RepID=UPI002936712E|nr:hypothetical protein [Phytobacter diazotrophicus]MDV2901033.1 hypothetical protein [Phytobacter diazotrophicus]